jgi:hypothetical protein
MDLAFSVDGVLAALAAQPHRSRGEGRALMFIAARRKEGASTAARAVAEAAGPGAVYAIDLDLKRNALARSFAEHTQLGPKIEGRLSGSSFYAVCDANGAPRQEATQAFSYHRVGRSRIYTGVFEANALPPQSRVVISSAPHYWDAVRAGGAVAVVDAPALERSNIGLRVARNMDGVVLVVGSDAGAAPPAIAAKEALVSAGANVIGIVYSGASAPVMAIERLLRQAG